MYGSLDSTLCQFDAFFKKYMLKNFAKFFKDDSNQLTESSFDDSTNLKVLDSQVDGSDIL